MRKQAKETKLKYHYSLKKYWVCSTIMDKYNLCVIHANSTNF